MNFCARLTLLLTILSFLFITASCGGQDGDGVVFEDDEADGICLGDNPYVHGTGHIQPDEKLEVTVVLALCLPSCGISTEEPSCEIEGDGFELNLTSYGAYESKHHFGGCPDVCREYTVTCEGPVLDEGTYTITHGEESYTFDVPGSQEDEACFYE